MRKMKLISFLLIMVMALTVLGGCTSNEAPESEGGGETGEKESKGDSTVLRVAFNQPDTHPQFKAMVDFGEKLEEESDGKYKVEVYPNELLGPQRETIELVQSGSIDMAIIGASLLESFNEDFAVLNLPYLYNSMEHQMDVINDEEIAGELYDTVLGEGIKILAGFHGGIRNVYTKEKPINTPEDLAGMKIRIIDSDTNLKMMEYMGGVGTAMGQGEVYTAIQSGVIDGGENNELIYENLQHAEIAPYYSRTEHLMMPDMLIMSADLFEELGSDLQEFIKTELKNTVDLEVELWEEEVEKAIEGAEEAGATFNDVDVELFRERVLPLHEEKVKSELAKSIYQKIRDAAK